MKNEDHYFLRCGVPLDNLEAEIESIDSSIRTKVLEFIDGKGVFLVMVGPAGTGKSYIGAAVLKRFGSGVFITPAQLTTLARSLPLTGPDTTKADLIETLMKCRLLVLDELGLSTQSSGEFEIIDTVLSFRHDRQLPTVLVSNLGGKELSACLGDRIADRVRQRLVFIQMLEKSRREPDSKPRSDGAALVHFNGSLPPKEESPQFMAEWKRYLAERFLPPCEFQFATPWDKTEFLGSFQKTGKAPAVASVASLS